MSIGNITRKNLIFRGTHEQNLLRLLPKFNVIANKKPRRRGFFSFEAEERVD